MSLGNAVDVADAGCLGHGAVPLSCVLTPRAARLLGAQLAGDTRTVEAELRRQHHEQALGLPPRAVTAEVARTNDRIDPDAQVARRSNSC
jgi:hypothetical protein